MSWFDWCLVIALPFVIVWLIGGYFHTQYPNIHDRDEKDKP